MSLEFEKKLLFSDITVAAREADEKLDEAVLASRKLILIAANRMIRNHPFFASLMMRTRHIISRSVPTAGTTGTEVFYNPFYVSDTLGNADSVVTLIAHEMMHDAMLHSYRMRGRNEWGWNIATDFAINNELIDAGFQVDPDMLQDRAFQGQSSEEIYDQVVVEKVINSGQGAECEDGQGGDELEQQSQGGSGAEGDSDDEKAPEGQGDTKDEEKEATGSEDIQEKRTQDQKEEEETRKLPERVDVKIEREGGRGRGTYDEKKSISPEAQNLDQILPPSTTQGTAGDQLDQDTMEQALNAAIRAASAVGNMPGNIKRFVKKEFEDHRREKKNWKEIIAAFVTESCGQDDYSWKKPNPRYQHLGVVMPSMVGKRIADIVIAVDTSGSIDEVQLGRFAEHIEDIVMELPDFIEPRVHVVTCDTRVDEENIKHLTKEDIPFEMEVTGGGGTQFSPPFRWVEEQGIQPKCLIYFTDLQSNDYPEQPEYPVSWLVFANRDWQRHFEEWAAEGDPGQLDQYGRPTHGLYGVSSAPPWVVPNVVFMDQPRYEDYAKAKEGSRVKRSGYQHYW